MDKTKVRRVWQSEKYYQIAAKGSQDTGHPAMIILKKLAERSRKVLDLGCGEGTRLNWLTSHGTGIDISDKAIAIAKKKYPRQRFLVGDLKSLPFKKEKFDLIYSAYVFEHLDNPEKVIVEAIKVLDKNGKLVIIAPNYGSPNRASPPFKGNRMIKLLSGLIKDVVKSQGLSWRRVNPIATDEKYYIDWDTTNEPHIKTLIDYLESQHLRILYADSCWDQELPGAGILQKISRLFGSRGVFPFKWWGPHLLVVAERPGETPRCVYCSGKKFKTLFKVNNSFIEVCGDCGLIRTNGLITANYQAYHRDEVYRLFEKHFKNIFGRIYRDIVKTGPEKGKALEVGCSTGILLSIFKQKGWEVWGIESSLAAKEASSKGIKILNTSFDRVKLEGNLFDLVILNHTLEHMDDPIKVIRRAYQFLKKDGILFVGVPNAGSLSANLMGKHWPYVLPNEHLYHFYPQILKKIMTDARFEIISEKARSGIFNLDRPLAGLLNEFTSLKKSFIFDFLSIPGAALATLINRGTNLTVIAKKPS